MRIIALEEHFTIASMTQAYEGHPLVKVFQQADGLIPRALQDIGAGRVAAMDEAGIDVQILSQTTPGPETLGPVLGVRLAQESNDALAAAVASNPARFRGFASLPLGDPAAAARELDRAVVQLGFVGANINGHVNGEYLDHQKYWPVFEKAEELDVPIYLHPTRPAQPVVDALYGGLPPVVSEALATGGWGWHADTALHSLRLILAGVFQRFPGLQLVIGHQGEFLPAAIDRAEQVFGGFGPRRDLDIPVKSVFEEHFWITTSGLNTYPPFAAVLHALGTDRVLFSTDYPYLPMKPSVQYLESLPISERDRAKIAHRNAERLLRVDPRPLSGE